MSVLASRNFVSWVMVILFPLSLLAVDTGSAIVPRNGGVRGSGAALVLCLHSVQKPASE
jgi:hypothetical protein